MTHDPLCGWSTPCIHGEGQKHSRDTENSAADATYCWMCGADCQCALIDQVIAVAVQRVEALANEMRNWSSAETTAATEAVPDLTVDQWLWVQRGVLRSIAAIKGDQP